MAEGTGQVLKRHRQPDRARGFKSRPLALIRGRGIISAQRSAAHGQARHSHPPAPTSVSAPPLAGVGVFLETSVGAGDAVAAAVASAAHTPRISVVEVRRNLPEVPLTEHIVNGSGWPMEMRGGRFGSHAGRDRLHTRSGALVTRGEIKREGHGCTGVRQAVQTAACA